MPRGTTKKNDRRLVAIEDTLNRMVRMSGNGAGKKKTKSKKKRAKARKRAAMGTGSTGARDRRYRELLQAFSGQRQFEEPPLVRIPDGYPVQTSVIRLTCARTITSDASGRACVDVRGWTPSAALREASTLDTNGVTGWGAWQSYAGYSPAAAVYGEMRRVCTVVSYEYIGPHGTDLHGVVLASPPTLLGDRTYGPIHDAASLRSDLTANPRAARIPIGQNFSFVFGPATEAGWCKFRSFASGAGTLSDDGQMGQFIFLEGAPVSTDLYRVVVKTACEVTPLPESRDFVGVEPPESDPGVMSSIAGAISRGAEHVWDFVSSPFGQDLISNYVGVAAGGAGGPAGRFRLEL